jgi:hypothetical protein
VLLTRIPRIKRSILSALAIIPSERRMANVMGEAGIKAQRFDLDRGLKVVSHGRYVMFQMAEAAVPRQMFHNIEGLIARLRALPAPV